MQGRRFGPVRGGVLFAVLAAVGCGEREVPVPREVEPPPGLAARFDPKAAGAVEGRLTWVGEGPAVPPFVSPSRPLVEPPRELPRSWENPNAPAIDPRTGGVADMAVFLRGIDPARSRPWDLEPARVEMRDYRLRVHQGGRTSRFGFVRRGGPVEVVSADEHLYRLEARGAAFFSLALPDPHRPCTRRLPHRGVVELASAAGQFWVRGYLFVDDHPYYTRTDTAGRFRLPLVPEGEYELVCWLPSWQAARRERDGETALVARLSFRPPVELVRKVVVQRGRTARVELQVSTGAFRR